MASNGQIVFSSGRFYGTTPAVHEFHFHRLQLLNQDFVFGDSHLTGYEKFAHHAPHSRLPKFPKKLQEPNPRSGFLTRDQYAALQGSCKFPWLRTLLAVAYNFGFRKSELLGLKVSQVDLKAKTIRLLPGETKSGHGRTVVMTSDVLPLLAACMEGKTPGEAVFNWGSGRPVKDFRGAWSKIAKQQELKCCSMIFAGQQCAT